MRLLIVAEIVTSCASHGAEPVVTESVSSGIVAEVHVHQYGDGSHIAAGFSERPVPLHPELDEQLVQWAYPSLAHDGACDLYSIHDCDPTCDGTHQWCSATNVCSEYVPLHYVDGGPVVVTGSSLAPKITLTFDTNAKFYRSDRPIQLEAFAAGDKLAIDVGGTFAFHANAVAPEDPELVEPSGSFSLGAPDSFYVAWKGKGERVTVRLTANTKSGESAWISCTTDDAGSLVIPKTLIEKLPPAPRDLRLEVVRFDREIVSLARAGEQAVLYVGSTRFVTGFD
ncbi:MAG: hypothetical protein ACXWUG_06365 [Polyangiales bacterium]